MSPTPLRYGRRLKIGLFLDADLAKPGGVQEYVRGLADYLNRHDAAATIISPPSQESTSQPLGRRLEIERLLHWTKSSASAAITWERPETIRKYLSDENFDLIHLMAPFGILGTQLVNEATPQKIPVGISFLVRRHSTPIKPFLKIAHALLAGVNHKINFRIAISQAASDYAQEILPGAYQIIPAGIDTRRFSPQGTKIELFADGKTNLLFVGRLDERKGIDYLLEAFVKIKMTHPETRLVIVGNGPKENPLKRFVKEQQLEDVVFVGYVDQETLPGYYRSAQIACFPATGNESFGIVLIEALASGLPVIASEIEGYREVLTGELKDLLVKPQDPAALAEKINSLLDQPEKIALFRQRSLEQAQKYGWEVVGGQIEEAYRRTLTNLA